MKRRDFITLAGGAAIAWPLVARAQQSAMPIIGLLNNTTFELRRSEITAFHRGLEEFGYVQGHNIAIQYRWAEGRYDRLPLLAADLVRAGVSLLVATGGEPVALAAQAAVKSAASAIPIVFIVAGDPVAIGLVDSLNRPGGNATGVSLLATQLEMKRLQIAQELIPNAEALAFLANPNNPITESATREMQLAAATLGQRLFVLKASTRAEIDAAFLEFAGRRVGGVLPQGDGFLFGQRDQIISLAAQHAIPGIYSQREFVTAGGLMSYGSSITDGYRQIGTYAARILKGERPSDLPIQQSTKVDLVINLKTAKTLGLNIPLSLLGRANEVIE
jgi:putative ABC transport system substrate-binding protein